MSKRIICAMGGSHVAAAKVGWDAVAVEFPGYDIEFFGLRGVTWDTFSEYVKAEDNSLVPTDDAKRRDFEWTSRGKTEIDGRRYSAFVMFGLGARPNDVVRAICGKHRLADHATPDSLLISRICLAAAIEGYLRSDNSLAPMRAIRSISDAPIVQQSPPVPTLRIADNPIYKDDPLSSRQIVSTVKTIYDEKAAKVAASEGYIYLKQPDSTLADSGFTKHKFITGGLSFAGGAKRDSVNMAHGNQRYGILIVRQVLRQLSQILA